MHVAGTSGHVRRSIRNFGKIRGNAMGISRVDDGVPIRMRTPLVKRGYLAHPGGLEVKAQSQVRIAT